MARIAPGRGFRSFDLVPFPPEIALAGSVVDAEEWKREGLRLGDWTRHGLYLCSVQPSASLCVVRRFDAMLRLQTRPFAPAPRTPRRDSEAPPTKTKAAVAKQTRRSKPDRIHLRQEPVRIARSKTPPLAHASGRRRKSQRLSPSKAKIGQTRSEYRRRNLLRRSFD